MTKINKVYKAIYFITMTGGLATCLLYFLQPEGVIAIALFCIMMISGILVIKKCIQALFILPGSLPLMPLFTGLTLIIGGAAFDIINTLMHSPDLKREANPIAHILINHELSLKQIYCIGFLSQSLYITVISLLWANFLKAYPIMIKKLIPRSFFGTALVIFGGPDVGKWDWFIGKVDYFFYISSITPMIVALSLYRWYLGLEWLELVPISRVLVPTLVCVGSFFGYLYLTYNRIKNRS